MQLVRNEMGWHGTYMQESYVGINLTTVNLNIHELDSFHSYFQFHSEDEHIYTFTFNSL